MKGTTYSFKQKLEREDDSPSSPELPPVSSFPTRSSIRSAGGRGVNEMHVDFASVIESDKQIKKLKNRSEDCKEQKILDETGMGEDSFENVYLCQFLRIIRIK